jgi:hypothetical protein
MSIFRKKPNGEPEGVTLQKNRDGSENPAYVDLLDEDKPIAGQKFACLSFISPEEIIKQKDHFFFEKFLHYWDYNKSMEKFIQFLNFLSFKHHLEFDKITEDFQEFTKEEKEQLQKTNIYDEYKTFLDKNEEELEAKFGESHGFQTSVRGLKVRGVFGTQKEAELRCQMLREVDPNHDVYVGPVGMWVPFHPEAYKTGRVEYMEETLNQLMAEKKKNEEHAKAEFDKRVKESKAKAIEENKKLAAKTGNKLTQMVTEDGELVGVTESPLSSSNISMTVEEVRKELFEGDDIVMDKNTDRGLSRLTENQEKE